MKQHVYFALVTESENHFRRMNNVFAIRSSEKRQKKGVHEALLAAGFRRPPLRLDDGTDNTIDVILIRVSAGALDDDGVRGAMKSTRDAISEWIDIDDRDYRIRFRYLQQQGPRGFHGVRIGILDRSMGPDIDATLGKAPTFTSEPEERPTWGRPGVPRKPEPKAKTPKVNGAKQPALPLLRCYAIYPWDQSPDRGAVITELDELNGATPPSTVRARRRKRDGQVIEAQLIGRRVTLPPPWGECMLYQATK